MTLLLQDLGLFLAASPPSGGAAGGGSSTVQTFVFMGLIFVVFWFFMIRPQRQKQKKREAMLKALEKGHKVVSIGGIRGVVTKTSDAVVTVKVDDNCKIEFSRSAIAEVIVEEKETARPAESSDEKKLAIASNDKGKDQEEKEEGGAL